jgi:hypothetical protein
LFENRELGRIFGPNRNEEREWRKLHNEELMIYIPNPVFFR